MAITKSEDFRIELARDLRPEIQLDETQKTVGVSTMYHLWVDTPIDMEALKQIISDGIRQMSKKEKDRLLTAYNESF